MVTTMSDADPTNFTSRMELLTRERIIKGEDPDGVGDHADAVFLELWADEFGERYWSLALFDDYRPSVGSGLHLRLTDEEAGWIKRRYEAANEGEADAE